MENKKLCSIHYLRYTGRVCPYCEKERIERMTARIKSMQPKNENNECKVPNSGSSAEETHYTMEDLIKKYSN